jgi:hypothetical protein
VIVVYHANILSSLVKGIVSRSGHFFNFANQKFQP